MGSKKNVLKKKSTNRLTKRRRQKNLRKKYRGGEGEPNVFEPEPEVKPSGFMDRIKDFWNWMTGKKDVPSPTNGEIPEASPFEEPVEASPFEEPAVEASPFEEPVETTPFEEPVVEEPVVETTPFEEPTVEKPTVEEPTVETSPFKKPDVETGDIPIKMGGRKKNRSTKKRRKQ